MENNLPFHIELDLPMTEDVGNLFSQSFKEAQEASLEFFTPEQVLLELFSYQKFTEVLKSYVNDTEKIKEDLTEYLTGLDKIYPGTNITTRPSAQLTGLLINAEQQAIYAGKKEIEMLHIINELMELPESHAAFFLKNALGQNEGEFMTELIYAYEIFGDLKDGFEELPEDYEKEHHKKSKKDWKKQVVCINDIVDTKNPLIGREDELEKTIRVLCRKEKNNPLHIGEPGVGKTALVYGLARRIENKQVPQKLIGSKIYQVDLGNLIAGTQFRGDFEKRISEIMDGVAEEGNAIIYIDEIHNLVGAGATGQGSMDASNMLKPYLEAGNIRFIGATTYDEYKRYFERSKGIVRRFSNIDVPEPSVEETIDILQQLKPIYEKFHGVIYTEEAIDYAVKGSHKHINDRFLPDKAIDLIDESGAMKQMEKNDTEGIKTVNKDLVSKVLAKICKVDSLAQEEKDNENLENLNERISDRIYGQPRAVAEVSEAVLMSKAGLTDENKPLASLLFVGPTGVGKTEVAKVLADEMGVELIRFDMSEYTEKHTVAKLIGSPAGYVGYEDGGLLTDAIRKTPNAVLLLDEIEKAHQDIYNILLQVMDYARLTDNKGNKADFRNVVLIMTSNAGAQFAAQANVGFAGNITRGDAMMKQVKRTFKPEFLNRLSATVVFNDMNRDMAAQILDKKIKELEKSLTVRKVRLEMTTPAKEYLLEKGFTKEYGARELDRVIQQNLKKLLMKEILFGKLKDGGDVVVKVSEDNLKLEI